MCNSYSLYEYSCSKYLSFSVIQIITSVLLHMTTVASTATTHIGHSIAHVTVDGF